MQLQEGADLQCSHHKLCTKPGMEPVILTGCIDSSWLSVRDARCDTCMAIPRLEHVAADA
jgi:hypothetical protein